MDNTKTELLEKIKAASTALVTVSKDPTVDELAACIGMALLLSKLKKHATAVFSGDIPSTIEFLKPEETLEKTPDSLRDFIISLDRNKADKLRYKVEDKLVKIFITPYRTSINEDDLEFSQGEYNVDLVITLGVENNDDLDKAINAGGNVLHDATVVSVSTKASSIGSINWSVPQASSLCELVAELAVSLGDKLFDEQIATALLTGIVAETERFSNDKTSSLTMSLSSQLMAAGANQQLVASELSQGGVKSGKSESTAANDGELDIKHDEAEDGVTQLSDDTSVPINDSSTALGITDNSVDAMKDSGTMSMPPLEPTMPTAAEPTTNDLGGGFNAALPDIPKPSTDTQVTPSGFTPPPPSWAPPFEDNDLKAKVDQKLSNPDSTIKDIEESVDSPHLKEGDTSPEDPQPAVPPPPSNLKEQLNQLIPQISPDMAASSPTAASATEGNKDADNGDNQTSDDPKAPPYPPPLVPPTP